MPDNFRERRDLEQYFYTKSNIDKFISAFTMAVEDEKELE